MVKEAKWRKGGWAKGRKGRGSVSEHRCGRHIRGEAADGTYAMYWTNMTEGLWSRLEVFWLYKPIRPFADSPIRRFAFSSYAERQATPVAGGEVFRRRTRTLTFMD
jgi:hypothetical protein